MLILGPRELSANFCATVPGGSAPLNNSRVHQIISTEHIFFANGEIKFIVTH